MPRKALTPEQKEARRIYMAGYYQRNRAKIDGQHEARRHAAAAARGRPDDEQWERVK